MRRTTGCLLVGCWFLLPTMPVGAEEVRLALLGGLTASELDWEPSPAFTVERDQKNDLGASVAVALADHWALDVRAMYLRRGIRLVSESGAAGNVALDYLSFPVLVKLRSAPKGTTAYVVGGVELALKTRAELVWDGVEDSTFDNQTASNDVAILAGVGFEFPISKDKPTAVLVEGLASSGVRNIIDTDVVPDTKVKSKGFLLHLGVRF